MELNTTSELVEKVKKLADEVTITFTGTNRYFFKGRLLCTSCQKEAKK